MTFTPRARFINPRLGIYFGIFASAFCALVLILLMLEEMGISRGILSLTMLVGALSALLTISVASSTNDALDFFAAGRRVPAVYCGVGLAVSTLGATGIAGCKRALVKPQPTFLRPCLDLRRSIGAVHFDNRLGLEQQPQFRQCKSAGA